MNFIFPPHAPSFVEVEGVSEYFPVHRIYCVGRNYAELALEMGADPDREEPFFFCKPADAVVHHGSFLDFPSVTQNLHHEIELVVALQKGGKDIGFEEALDCVFGYAVGIDLTRRDLQGAAKKMGRPWDSGKAFDESAPCSAIRPATAIGHPQKGTISLDVNGETRQYGDLEQMIWKIPEVIMKLSQLFQLAPGDLIYTGTPAGVGPLQSGDLVHGRIEAIGELGITFR